MSSFDRRDFIKKKSALTALSLTGIGTAGTVMIGCADSVETPFKRVEKTAPGKSGMKIALQASAEYFASRKKIYGDAGINVFGPGNYFPAGGL
jgi:hypothetical protein